MSLGTSLKRLGLVFCICLSGCKSGLVDAKLGNSSVVAVAPVAASAPPVAATPISVPVSELPGLPVATPQAIASAPLAITCDIAHQISDHWDGLVDQFQPCLSNNTTSGNVPSGQLDSGLDLCTELNKSIQLTPALSASKTVLFGDDTSFSQSVTALEDGKECFTLTRKASVPGEYEYWNHFRVTKGANTLFDTSHDSNNLYVTIGSQVYFMPLDSNIQRAFNRQCGLINISGQWGSNGVYYGPNTVFLSFSFHISKSDGTTVSSTCKR